MVIPNKFKKKIIGAFGEDGTVWLERLVGIVEYYLGKWKLTNEGPVENLSYNYVLKVRDANETPLILKIGIANQDFKNEVNALGAYGGDGCARLVKADAEGGAMLLEQLMPGTLLSKVDNERKVVYEFMNVWRKIRRPVPEGIDFPSLEHWMLGLDRYISNHTVEQGLISKDLILLAKYYFQEINDNSPGPELLHGDLHHDNILFSHPTGWMAIDPKGVLGNHYFDLVSFLINDLHNKENPKDLLKYRVDTLCQGLQLERIRFLKACVTMSTLYACWGVEDQDPDWKGQYQCALWFQDWIEKEEAS